jgi:sporulation protein YlmC with PRC-barrel domain
VELRPQPFAFSELIGVPVEDPSGRALGRVWEARASWQPDGTITIDELLVGRGGLLKRLRGPGPGARGIPWENVTQIEARRIVAALPAA